VRLAHEARCELTIAALAGLVVFAPSVASGQLPAQNAPAREEFEAASVKPSPPMGPGPIFIPLPGSPGSPDPGRMTLTFATLKSILVRAYGVRNYQISGPAWLDTEHYDIVATVWPDATKEQANQMPQNLLAERFKVTLHHETRDFPLYELQVAKNGPKLKESVESAEPKDAASQNDAPPGPMKLAPPTLDKDGFPQLLPGRPGLAMIIVNGRIRLTAVDEPVSELANMLNGQLGRRVVDKTGLAGKYDFNLDFSPIGGLMGTALPPGAQPGAAAAGADARIDVPPDLVVAVQEKLGLKLEPQKGPVDNLVIDHIEKPDAN